MASDDGSKRYVTSGSLQFNLGPDGLVVIQIPVAEAKADEAIPLIEDLYSDVLNHYNKSNKMNPTDVARCLRAVSEAIERYTRKLTEEKYNATKRRTRA